METALVRFVEEAGEGDAEAGSGAENSNKKAESRKSEKVCLFVGGLWRWVTPARL